MAIAIDLSNIGSISTYSDLLFEIRDMQDNSEYDVSAISRALRKVEALCNRELRTPDMETRAPLAIVDGAATLPDDCLAIRKIYRDAMIAQVGLNDQALASDAYTVEGNQVFFTAVPAPTTATLLYYAAIPPLTDNQATNWLLTKHSDLYVTGVRAWLADREGDAAVQVTQENKFAALLESIKSAAQSARYGGGPLVPHIVSQVRGARI